MKLRLSGLLRSLSLSVLAASAAFAVTTITVTPSVGPNPFDSPSFGTYATNAIAALNAGSTTAGTPGTPGFYQALTGNLQSTSILSTAPPFTSWNGVANPAAPFDGEFGNYIFFGLRIEDPAVKFSLAQLGIVSDTLFIDTSNCTAPCFSDYRTDLVGIDYVDGIFGNGNDIIYTSGASTQLVNRLIYVGDSLSFFINNGNQAALNAAAAAVNANTGIAQVVYQLGTLPPVTSTIEFDHTSGVPEPATYTLFGAGLALVFVLRRR